MLPGSCEGVDIHDPVTNQTIPLWPLRQRLQGSIRAFGPGEFAFRLPDAVGAAEILFDPDNEEAGLVFGSCPLGAAVLGAVLCVLASKADMQEVLHQPSVDSLMRTYPLQDLLWVLRVRSFGTKRFKALVIALFAINEAFASRAWDAGGGGWPFFAMLAMVSEHVDLQARAPRLGLPSGLSAGWRAWLASGEWEPPHALRRMARLRRGSLSAGACSPASTLAAAVLRPAQAALAAATSWARRCRKAAGFQALFGSHLVPVWRSFDRAGSPRSVDVAGRDPYGERCGLSRAAAAFRMSLLPPHIRTSRRSRDSLRFVADRIRARGAPHCNPVFQTLANVVAEVHERRNVTFVDVGAHLGDCCLWAVARWGPGRVKCVAFERNGDAAGAMRRSVSLAGLDHAVTVRRRTIGEARGGDCSAPARVEGAPDGGGGEGVPLDCFLAHMRFVDLVKIHVGLGRELSVLAGMLQSLQAGKVGLCLVRTTDLPAEYVRAFVQAHGLPYDFHVARGGEDTILRLLNYD